MSSLEVELHRILHHKFFPQESKTLRDMSQDNNFISSYHEIVFEL